MPALTPTSEVDVEVSPKAVPAPPARQIGPTHTIPQSTPMPRLPPCGCGRRAWRDSARCRRASSHRRQPRPLSSMVDSPIEIVTSMFSARLESTCTVTGHCPEAEGPLALLVLFVLRGRRSSDRPASPDASRYAKHIVDYLDARDLCLIAPFSRYTTPFGAELLVNSATKARPISSCSIVPKRPGIRRPNQAT